MFALDDFPQCCPHCQTEIAASVYAEDFYAGATIACRECKSKYRYCSKEDMKHVEAPPTDKTTQPMHCTQCCQPLPPGQKHPAYFCQNSLTPDLTAVHDLHGELDFILSHINTVSEVLMELYMNLARQHQDGILFGLYQLLSQLADEAELRGIRLRNAGMHWQGEDRNDGSPFPDLPPPRKHDLHGKTCVR